MKVVFVILIMSFYVSCQNLDDDGWKGLKPLQSSEKEVQAMFGKGESDRRGYTVFKGEGFNLRVLFSPGRCSDDTFGKPRYSIPKGKIIEYIVYFKDAIDLASLQFHRRDYALEPDPEILDRFVLRSPSNEVVIMAGKVGGKEVFNQIWIRPSPESFSKLKCN